MTALASLLISGVVFGFLALPARGFAMSARFALQLKEAALPPAERAPVRAFLDDIERGLPPRLKSKIDRPIGISFVKLDDLPQVRVPICEVASQAEGRKLGPPQRLGQALLSSVSAGIGSAELRLHRGLVEVIVRGPHDSPSYPCGHGSLYQLARATVIHEIFHIYDKLEWVSERPTYQHLHRFERQGFLRTLKTRNTLKLRSPDPYEFSNIRENFAVHAEYYSMDPEYKCRKPAIYHYFEQEFHYRPFPDSRCELGTTVYAGDRPVRLDPERVYQVHYLWAARGQAMESRWGHAMFRLILCAPERKQVDEKCLQDVQHHIVISFVANLGGDLRTSIWKGLTGGYLSQLFLRPMSDIIIEYTELEFRDLHSYPLLLSQAEKLQLVRHVLEMYWSYAGRYYFFTNNCAVESSSLVKSIAESPLAQSMRSLTPSGLRDDLLSRKLAAPIELHDPAAAEKRGLFFRSLHDMYESEFAQLLPKLPEAAPRSLKRWLHGTRSHQRRLWFDSLASAGNRVLFAQLFGLEGLIMSIKRKELERRLAGLYYEPEITQKYARLGQALRRLTHALRQNMPWERLRGGYGVPLQRELGGVQAPMLETLFGVLEQETLQVLRVELPSEYDELRQLQDNRRFLLEQAISRR
jgi:hypothetical protein